MTFVLPKKSLRGFLGKSVGFCSVLFPPLLFLLLGGKRKIVRKGVERALYLLSDNCVRTSLRYVLRMLWTLKT